MNPPKTSFLLFFFTFQPESGFLLDRVGSRSCTLGRVGSDSRPPRTMTMLSRPARALARHSLCSGCLSRGDCAPGKAVRNPTLSMINACLYGTQQNLPDREILLPLREEQPPPPPPMSVSPCSYISMGKLSLWWIYECNKSTMYYKSLYGFHTLKQQKSLTRLFREGAAIATAAAIAAYATAIAAWGIRSDRDLHKGG